MIARACRGRRARARSARRGRAARRRAGQLPALCSVTPTARRRSSAASPRPRRRTIVRTSSRSGPRAGRSRRRRVRARSGRPRPRRAARRTRRRPSVIATAGTLHVADRGELERGTTARRSRARSGSRTTRAGRAGRRGRATKTSARAGRVAASHLRQPEPRVQRGQDEDQRERVCCQRRATRRRRARAARPSRRRAARRRATGRRGTSRWRATIQPASTTTPSAEQREHGPVAGRRRVGVRRPRQRRSGHAPSSAEARRRRARRRARSRGGCAGCAPRAASGMPRRRQWAKRSTAPTRNGMSSADQQQLDRPAADDPVAGPDEARRPLRELEPWSSEPRSSCAARPIASSRPRVERERRSVNASGGRSPAVVRVIAGMPRATNGPCS